MTGVGFCVCLDLKEDETMSVPRKAREKLDEAGKEIKEAEDPDAVCEEGGSNRFTGQRGELPPLPVESHAFARLCTENGVC